MSRYLVDRIEATRASRSGPSTTIVALDGDGSLRGVRIADLTVRRRCRASALFSFIGADPDSAWLSGCAALDDRGFVLTDRSLSANHSTSAGRRWGGALPFETSYPGLFAVGDVRSGSTKRVPPPSVKVGRRAFRARASGLLAH